MCNGIAVQWQLCLGEEHATTTSVEILWPTNTSTISTTTTIPFDEPLLVSESKRYNIIDGQLCLDTNEQSTNQTSDESGNSNSGNRLLANCPHSDFGQKIASHISPSIFNITNKIIAPQSGNGMLTIAKDNLFLIFCFAGIYIIRVFFSPPVLELLAFI